MKKNRPSARRRKSERIRVWHSSYAITTMPITFLPDVPTSCAFCFLYWRFRRSIMPRRPARYRHSGQRGLKQSVWFSQFGRLPLAPCRYCNRLLTFNQATLEHIHPRAYGGSSFSDNLDIACPNCNNTKAIAEHGLCPSPTSQNTGPT